MKQNNLGLTPLLWRSVSMLCVLSIAWLVACKEQAFDEHYQRPDWLKGNAWEWLESSGNYSIFMDAIDKSGFKGLVNGKGIVTVMAPDDDAFAQYFQQKGLSGIDDLPKAQLRKLVGYHLIYYSYNQDQLRNFQPYGRDVQLVNSEGLFYKHRTHSRDTVSERYDELTGKTRQVFHKERFLPVMSSDLFATKGIDAVYNYEYFFDENSTWSGGADGFNVSNASVKEYNLPTDNGYLYTIDAVLEPLETIYTEIADQPEYSQFLSLYDEFINFWYDEETSNEYAAIGDSLYIIRHDLLPEIASEWSYNGESGIPDYANLPDLTSKAYNVFAPNNQAIDNFFDEYWSTHYSSMDDVGFLPIAYLLYNHVNQGSIVFPEEIVQNKISTPYGNAIVFDPDEDVIARKLCVNGSFYGLGSVIVPDMFSSVTGPVFQNPDYEMFLYMLDATDLIGPLMSDALDFTLFIPSNEVVSDVLFENSYIYWNEGNPLKKGDEYLEVENDNGARVAMGVSSMRRFVNNHIVNARIDNFSKKAAYQTRNNFSYIFTAGDSIDTNQSYNKGVSVNASEIEGDWTNGKVYTVDNVLIREIATIKSLIGSTSSSANELHHISEFGLLLANAGLIDADAELEFLLGDEFLMFAPSNEVIIAAKEAGTLPTDKDELAEYLKYYFVPLSLNSINDFPMAGLNVEGTFKTAQFTEGVGSAIFGLQDDGTDLTITDGTGAVANVISQFPSVYSDGAVYVIDALLQPE